MSDPNTPDVQTLWLNQIRTIDDLQEQIDLLRRQAAETYALVQWHEEHQTHLKAHLAVAQAEIPMAFRAGFVANIARHEGTLSERRVWAFTGGAHTADDLVAEAYEQWLALKQVQC